MPGTNEVAGVGASAYLIAHALDWLRRRNVITSLKQHRLIALVISIATSLGLHFSIDNNTGAFAITGSVHGLIIGIGHVAMQYGAVDYAYKVAARVQLESLFDGTAPAAGFVTPRRTT